VTTSSRRDDFPLLVRQPELHYLDSAATAQKPAVVLDAIREFYETVNANPHRGAYTLSVRATEAYHDARARLARFFGVSDPAAFIFTRGTTESINLVASSWGPIIVQPGDEIIVTAMDHHGNFVPWQQLAIRRQAHLRIWEMEPDGTLDLAKLQEMLSERTGIVAFNHVSNALGTINPVRAIAELARAAGATSVCDGAQSAPHMRVDFESLGVDFYAFSGHKMCGPMGIGGLIGRRELLETMPPYQTGGDMIEFVRDQDTTWNVLPHKFEAGTPNAANAVGLAAAADYLDSIGMDEVQRHEHALMEHAYERLSEIDALTIYGPAPDKRSGVISFTLADVHPHDLATVLDGENVCIRAGHHCAQPLMRRLGVAATARASFYLYNNDSDVDALVRGLHRAREIFGVAGGAVPAPTPLEISGSAAS
jgi:cysteine desulfurase / selenocysteine lyase